ncbi:hypothetical protein I3760_03G070500 [Carya illinoinensis]|nr:hypothetical protein I3760_03G070500 [Carya illinoinensis]
MHLPISQFALFFHPVCTIRFTRFDRRLGPAATTDQPKSCWVIFSVQGASGRQGTYRKLRWQWMSCKYVIFKAL